MKGAVPHVIVNLTPTRPDILSCLNLLEESSWSEFSVLYMWAGISKCKGMEWKVAFNILGIYTDLDLFF